MNIGALVVKRSRWGINSQIIGIIVDKSYKKNDCWLVLWTLAKSYKLQEHMGSALLDLSETADDYVKLRTQTVL